MFLSVVGATKCQRPRPRFFTLSAGIALPMSDAGAGSAAPGVPDTTAATVSANLVSSWLGVAQGEPAAARRSLVPSPQVLALLDATAAAGRRMFANVTAHAIFLEPHLCQLPAPLRFQTATMKRFLVADGQHVPTGHAVASPLDPLFDSDEDGESDAGERDDLLAHRSVSAGERWGILSPALAGTC